MFTRAFLLMAVTGLLGFSLQADDCPLSKKMKVSTSNHDIVGVATKAGMFKTLLAAAGAAELVETLRGEGPFTVLAPTDEAFKKLPEGAVASLLKPENKHKLKAVLLYHVIPGKVTAKAAIAAGKAKTVQGESVKIDILDGQLTINKAKVIKTDIEADNGIIHVIDQVLMPH
jgi:transforming growth factor-beta-induced protein